jgi:hypothetical protein
MPFIVIGWKRNFHVPRLDPVIQIPKERLSPGFEGSEIEDQASETPIMQYPCPKNPGRHYERCQVSAVAARSHYFQVE